MKYFFTVFLLEKMCLVFHAKESIYMKCQSLFSGESTAENINIGLSFAEFAERVVKINNIYLPVLGIKPSTC